MERDQGSVRTWVTLGWGRGGAWGTWVLPRRGVAGEIILRARLPVIFLGYGWLMQLVLPLIALAALSALIWYLGGGSFGRNQTQAWIDRVRSMPRVYAFLNRHHGKFRASAHYFEFGGLFLVLYWLYDAAWAGDGMAFRWVPAGGIWVVCAVAAFLDEMHQLQSGTRQFRRVDFLHSCCGISIAMFLVFAQHVLRGLE